MGETLAETRVEIAARRSDNESTAAELDARVRHALDVKARFRENPLIFIGLGVGAVFLLAGGPALRVPLREAPRRSLRCRTGLRRPAGADAGLGRHARQRVRAQGREGARCAGGGAGALAPRPDQGQEGAQGACPGHGRWTAGAIADRVEGGGDGGRADRGRARPQGDRGPRHRERFRCAPAKVAAPTSVASLVGAQTAPTKAPGAKMVKGIDPAAGYSSLSSQHP